ncbi:hypothetical protein [Aequorivita flava]|uniref:Uncharacterized protein n=1 Tax=Aequorivita flava TaxID=3114371 RepID=A0AB35YNZ6_9FLAO
MNIKLNLFFLLIFQIGISQQYDTVYIEAENIDENNKIYKPGSVFIYDYEINLNGEKLKLKRNEGMFANSNFELTPISTDSIGVTKIHLIVQPIENNNRSNENQTQISYFQEPSFASITSTGAVENEKNVWVHPIRSGFFNCLETAPFPFVKTPLKLNSTWTDKMQIGEGWGNKMWGTWEGKLLLTYNYKIVGTETLDTEMGKVPCFIVESTATSNLGVTKLKSFFS